jgi:phosphoserine phosphatase
VALGRGAIGALAARGRCAAPVALAFCDPASHRRVTQLDPHDFAALRSTAVQTIVYLVRHGVTDWHREGKLTGQRDIALDDDGLAQGERAAQALATVPIAEVLSSPLLRALQTAEIIGRRFGIEVARDPRLTDIRVGAWEGMTYDQIATSEDYRRFLSDPTVERIPGGEHLEEVRRRAAAAIEQALTDNPSGDGICVVTHAGIIRLLVCHYLGAPLGTYHRIRVSPGSVTALGFAGDGSTPRVLAVNWTGDLATVVHGR